MKGAGGFFIPAEMAAITVMESRTGWGDEYPEEWRNGTWEFAAFKPDDHTLVERDHQPCFECHKPLHEAVYVFSFDALTKAAGNLCGGARCASGALLGAGRRACRQRGHCPDRLGPSAHLLEPGGPLD